MKRATPVVAILAAVVIWWAWRSNAAASVQLDAAQSQLIAIQRDIAEIVNLRGQDQHIAERKPPERDVIARVNDALSLAGLPQRTLASLTPESDAALPGSTQYRRQSLRLGLRSVDLHALGAFLSAWRASQLVWTITQIELTHSRDRNCETCYDATLLLSAIYVQGVGT